MFKNPVYKKPNYIIRKGRRNNGDTVYTVEIKRNWFGIGNDYLDYNGLAWGLKCYGDTFSSVDEYIRAITLHSNRCYSEWLREAKF